MTGTVLITGAAGGIGQELTRLFAADGYRVLGFDLRGDALEALGKDLPDGCDYRPVAMDLSEPDAAVRVADWLDRHGHACRHQEADRGIRAERQVLRRDPRGARPTRRGEM